MPTPDNKRRVARGLLAAAVGMGLLAPVSAASGAQKQADGTKPASGADAARAAKPGSGGKAADPPRTEAVSIFFNRTPQEIEGLRSGGYGYGEIVKILVVAEMSRRPIPGLVERNRKGYGWGTISRELGLHPAAVKKRVDMARDTLGIHVHPAWMTPKKKTP